MPKVGGHRFRVLGTVKTPGPVGDYHIHHHWRFWVMPRYTLEAIIVVLLILWLLGAFVAPVGGNLIHLLLLVVVVVVVVRLLQGRRALP
jgi:Family of unknown function (DUF5670)